MIMLDRPIMETIESVAKASYMQFCEKICKFAQSLHTFGEARTALDHDEDCYCMFYHKME